MNTNIKAPTQEEIKDESIKIIDLIGMNKKIVEFVCNNGSVCINPDTFDFTYIGMFGDAVLGTVLKAKIMNDTASKISALAACKLIYSMNFGGFNVLAENFPATN